MNVEHLEHAWHRADDQQRLAVVSVLRWMLNMCEEPRFWETLNGGVGSSARFSDTRYGPRYYFARRIGLSLRLADWYPAFHLVASPFPPTVRNLAQAALEPVSWAP